ncbi:DUF418 domain-containing protein [Frondihabitans cladoniiphilus]|uniref:DUF418 domain-containing protein n=1 Tax=Frondihabitans cladoniiphilus TaxID=715785 RepID=A0ABP8VUS4_9MICO
MSTPTASVRYSLIDALRGFALFGILLVNARDLVQAGSDTGAVLGGDTTSTVLFFTVQTRFFVMFATLFGTSLFFVLSSARARHPRPWIPLVRRLVTLAVIGLALTFTFGNGILVEYALAGLIVLILVMKAPKRVVLIVGLVLTVGVYAAGQGGLAPLGLILLGFAAASYGLPRLLEQPDRRVVIVFVAAAVLSVPALILQTTQPGDPRYTYVGAIPGVIMATAYASGFVLLWHTRARRLLALAFEAMGRLALTNFAAGYVLVWATTFVVDYGSMTDVLPVVFVAVGIIALQAVASRLWLVRFQYGPLEWVWRTATWWKPAPMLRGTARGTRTA